jgi:hypothetical protein
LQFVDESLSPGVQFATFLRGLSCWAINNFSSYLLDPLENVCLVRLHQGALQADA